MIAYAEPPREPTTTPRSVITVATSTVTKISTEEIVSSTNTTETNVSKSIFKLYSLFIIYSVTYNFILIFA